MFSFREVEKERRRERARERGGERERICLYRHSCATVHVWRSVDNFMDALLSSHLMWVPGIEPTSLDLHSKLFCPLSHPLGLGHHNFKVAITSLLH